MPIYEYQCTACAYLFETLQKISDEPLTECPQCHQAALNKLVSAAGFQLKGTGWYVTDYSKKNKPEQSKTESNSSSTNSTNTEAKNTTETKSTEKKSSDSSGSSSSSSSSAASS
ncbi:MAG: zinc ribbon domain-containing protein [Gammaproteobacteria bacterium]|nr:zinc ribbon domain-containing protein [Gammaproteobacteria bacterium]